MHNKQGQSRQIFPLKRLENSLYTLQPIILLFKINCQFQTNSKIISFKKIKQIFIFPRERRSNYPYVTCAKNPMNIFLARCEENNSKLSPTIRTNRTLPIEYELGRSVRKLARYSLMTRKGIFLVLARAVFDTLRA